MMPYMFFFTNYLPLRNTFCAFRRENKERKHSSFIVSFYFFFFFLPKSSLLLLTKGSTNKIFAIILYVLTYIWSCHVVRRPTANLCLDVFT